MKILLTGANGFVGNKIRTTLESVIEAPSLREMTREKTERMIEESEADVIIHTAAISDTLTCQKNPEISYQANVMLPTWIAKAAHGKKVICFSSDQVYSDSEAEGPYLESDEKTSTVYGGHKLEMEQQVLDALPSAVILRAEWMYDYIAPRGNYLLNLLKAEEAVAFSSKQYRGITYLGEVADNIKKVIELPGGVYNFGSETNQSMMEITQKTLELLGRKIDVQDAPPRHNLWMNCSKAAKEGIVFLDVMAGIKKCLKDYRLIS